MDFKSEAYNTVRYRIVPPLFIVIFTLLVQILVYLGNPSVRIDFYNLYAEGEWLCELHPETRTLFRATEKLIITKLHCEDADLNGIWSFHAILKDDL